MQFGDDGGRKPSDLLQKLLCYFVISCLSKLLAPVFTLIKTLKLWVLVGDLDQGGNTCYVHVLLFENPVNVWLGISIARLKADVSSGPTAKNGVVADGQSMSRLVLRPGITRDGQEQGIILVISSRGKKTSLIIWIWFDDMMEHQFSARWCLQSFTHLQLHRYFVCSMAQNTLPTFEQGSITAISDKACQCILPWLPFSCWTSLRKVLRKSFGLDPQEVHDITFSVNPVKGWMISCSDTFYPCIRTCR